jgi:hypothetical protein
MIATGTAKNLGIQVSTGTLLDSDITPEYSVLIEEELFHAG